jgi:hypothetical protein
VTRARSFVASRASELACAAVFLGLAVVTTDIRMDGPWREGALLALVGGTFVALYAAGLLAPAADRPATATSVLLVAALLIAFPALIRLARVLGVDEPLDESGTMAWVFGTLALLALVPALVQGSAAAALVVAAGLTGAVLAGFDWLFEPSGETAFRYLLAGLAGVFFLAGLAVEGRRPRHGVVLVAASGLAATGLGMLLTGFFFFSVLFEEAVINPGWGWQTAQLFAGVALLLYAAGRRQPGPGYLGVIVLVQFAFGAGVSLEPDPSLLGWPLGLFIAAAVLLAVALRPRGGALGAGVPAVPPEPPPTKVAGVAVDPRDSEAT